MTIIKRQSILSCLLLIPMMGILVISSTISFKDIVLERRTLFGITLIITLGNFIYSLVMYKFFLFNTNQFQLVQERYDFGYFDIYLGIDGTSIYFVLLTTIIMPIAILANLNSITENTKSYLIKYKSKNHETFTKRLHIICSTRWCYQIRVLMKLQFCPCRA